MQLGGINKTFPYRKTHSLSSINTPTIKPKDLISISNLYHNQISKKSSKSIRLSLQPNSEHTNIRKQKKLNLDYTKNPSVDTSRNAIGRNSLDTSKDKVSSIEPNDRTDTSFLYYNEFNNNNTLPKSDRKFNISPREDYRIMKKFQANFVSHKNKFPENSHYVENHLNSKPKIYFKTPKNFSNDIPKLKFYNPKAKLNKNTADNSFNKKSENDISENLIFEKITSCNTTNLRNQNLLITNSKITASTKKYTKSLNQNDMIQILQTVKKKNDLIKESKFSFNNVKKLNIGKISRLESQNYT